MPGYDGNTTEQDFSQGVALGRYVTPLRGYGADRRETETADQPIVGNCSRKDAKNAKKKRAL